VYLVRFHPQPGLVLLLAWFALAAGIPTLAQVPAPEMVAVPQGAFLMGSEEGATWEKPAHRVDMSAFLIAARPVTNAQFRAFRPDHQSAVDNSDTAPVRGVSWEDAGAYCLWLRDKTGDAYRLPTEAEWERAIRGGLEQKKYPWGDDPAVPEAVVGDRGAWPPAPPNPFGLSIEHELWEWTADFYHRNYYQESPPSDPKGPAEGEFRVLRGGSYPNDPNSTRCSNRGSARPKTVLPNVTFRVARSAGSGEISELRQPDSSAQASPESAPPGAAVARTMASPPKTQAQPPSARDAATLSAAPARTAPATEPATPEAASAAPAPTNPAPPDPAPPAAAAPPDAAPAAAAPRQAPAASGQAVQLTRVDVTVSSVQVILALSLSGPAEYSTMELTSPGRLVIDLVNTAVATSRQYGSISVGDLGVERVRWAPFEASTPTARLVIDLTEPVTHSIGSAPSGLVIQLRRR
jgi:hypothetical protein